MKGVYGIVLYQVLYGGTWMLLFVRKKEEIINLKKSVYGENIFRVLHQLAFTYWES